MLADPSEIKQFLKFVDEKSNESYSYSYSSSSSSSTKTNHFNPIKLVNLNLHQKVIEKYFNLKQKLASFSNQPDQLSVNDLEEKKKIENELESIENVYLTSSHLKLVKAKIEKIRKKRKSKKLNLIRNRYLISELKKKREEIETQLDQSFRNEEKNFLIEKERESDLNKALNGIRLKINETKLILEKLRLLEKARGYLKASKTKSSHLKIFSNDLSEKEDSFFIKLEKIKNLTYQHLLFYKKEAETFQNLIKTYKNKKEKLKVVDKQQIIEALFGEKINYSFHFIKHFYKSSLSELIEIRKKWDCYISEEGSSVPSNWIIPPQNPNKYWQPYLHLSNNC